MRVEPSEPRSVFISEPLESLGVEDPAFSCPNCSTGGTTPRDCVVWCDSVASSPGPQALGSALFPLCPCPPSRGCGAGSQGQRAGAIKVGLPDQQPSSSRTPPSPRLFCPLHPLLPGAALCVEVSTDAVPCRALHPCGVPRWQSRSGLAVAPAWRSRHAMVRLVASAGSRVAAQCPGL